MKKEDLRVTKTKLLIKQAFFDLLEKKPFEKITIKDITDKAMINRGTFYLHYCDKYDLLESYEDQVIDDLRVYTDLITPESMEESKRKNLPLPHLIPLLTYIEEHPSFFLLISNNETSSSFYRKMSAAFYTRLSKVLDIAQIDYMGDYKKDLAVAVSSTILSRWGKTQMTTQKEQIAMLITKIIWSVLDITDIHYKPVPIEDRGNS